MTYTSGRALDVGGKSAIDDFEERLKRMEQKFRDGIHAQSLKEIQGLKKSREEDEWRQKLSGGTFDYSPCRPTLTP